MSKYRNNKFYAAKFKALSNPNRLELFRRLMSCCTPGTMCRSDEVTRYCVGELCEKLDIAPSTVSHHLKELSQAGLIQTKREGKTINCWVEPETLDELSIFFTSHKDKE